MFSPVRLSGRFGRSVRFCQRRSKISLGLSRERVAQVRQMYGPGAVRQLYFRKGLAVFLISFLTGWGVWMYFNLKRVPDDKQIYHAWLAVQAAHSSDPAQFVNQATVRQHSDFQSIATESMFGGKLRLVLLETPDTMYLAFHGPTEDPATHLLRTNRLDSTDVTPRDRAHSGLLKFMDGVPVFNIFDDSNWLEHHLVLCGMGSGGILAHNLHLQEVFRGHITPANNCVRSIAFGAPFCNHWKTRVEIENKWWKNCFLTVMNRKDPLPAMVSATLPPELLDGADDQAKANFARYKATLNTLLLDDEGDLDTPKGLARRQKLEAQLAKDFEAVRPLMRPETPEFAHFGPIGNWLFLDPEGGMPHVDQDYQHYPSTHELVWRRKDITEAFTRNAYLTNPVLSDARRSSYDATIKAACYNESDAPRTSRRLQVLNVAFPIYIPPKLR